MEENNSAENDVPNDHPRHESLTYRHKIIEGMKNLVVAEAGLIAHGRGECFDYILGERTNNYSESAMRAAVALLLGSKKPVISVNGNVAALVPDELVKFSELISAPLEINLFYHKKGRIEAITKRLRSAGASNLLGVNKSRMVQISELSSNRRYVDPDGIFISDCVFVPLEDGDRTEALKREGKKVITVDLNPISRTALWADITIVDNIIRVLPRMIEIAKEYNVKGYDDEKLGAIVCDFDNRKNIQGTLGFISDFINRQKEDAFRVLD